MVGIFGQNVGFAIFFDFLIGITPGLGRNWTFLTGFTLNCSRELQISDSLEQFSINPVEKVKFLPNPGVIPIKSQDL